MEEPRLVLTVDDDPSVLQYLRLALENHGFQVMGTFSGRSGLNMAAAHHPQVILLDLGLPDIDGIEVTRQLRQWTQVPILVVSGQHSQADKVAALDAGADDYITKPYDTEELLARVRAALRRSERPAAPPADELVTTGRLRLDAVRRQVFLDEMEVKLTPVEYKLLTALARRLGVVVSHRQLLVEVWGPEYAREYNYLRVYMRHLRHKLEPEPTEPMYLLSEPGVGYRLARR